MTNSNRLMICPVCKNQTLSKLKTDLGYFQLCEKCFGHFYNESNIYHYIPKDQWLNIISKSKNITSKRVLKCPCCENKMQVLILNRKIKTEIDRCANCQIIWFDKDEIENIPLREELNRQANKFGNDSENLNTGVKTELSLDQKAQILLDKVKIENMFQEKSFKQKLFNFILLKASRRLDSSNDMVFPDPFLSDVLYGPEEEKQFKNMFPKWKK